MELFAEKTCHRCRRITPQEVGRSIKADLSESFGWWCNECNWWSDGGNWIPKDRLTDGQLCAVRTVNFTMGERCARCGARGGQLHHWMPKSYKNDESWPKDWLCKKCHDEWHNIVTPGLVKVPFGLQVVRSGNE